MPAEGGGKGGKPAPKGKVPIAAMAAALGREVKGEHKASVESMVRQGAEALAAGMPAVEVEVQLAAALAGMGLSEHKKAILAAMTVLSGGEGGSDGDGSDADMGGSDDDMEDEEEDEGDDDDEEGGSDDGSSASDADSDGAGAQAAAVGHVVPAQRGARRAGRAAPDVDEAAFAAALEMIASDDDDVLLEGLVYFRKLLSREERPPIKQVRETGMLPRVVAVLKNDDNSLKLRFEAAWLLTNVASGDASDTLEVVKSGAVEAALECIVPPAEGDEHGDINMEEEEEGGGARAGAGGGRGRGRDGDAAGISEGELCAQCVWLIGNIAGEARFRDALLLAGAVPAMVRLLYAWIDGKGSSKLEWLRSATWASTNLVRGKPPPDPAAVRALLPVYARLVTAADTEVATNAAWGLAFMADLRGMPAEVREATTTLDGDEVPIMEAVVTIMRRRERVASISTPLLRCLGTMVSDDAPASTEAVVEAGAVPALMGLLRSPKKGIRKETWWTLSNIAAGTPEQLEKLLESSIAGPALEALEREPSDVRKEVLFTVGNVLGEGVMNPGEAVRDFALELLAGGVHTKLGKYTDATCCLVAGAIVGTLLSAMDDLQAPSDEVHDEWVSELEEARDALAR